MVDAVAFEFVMSISLCAGFLVALPMNWWLVDHGLKHGMMTVRHDDAPVPQAAAVALAGAALTGHEHHHMQPTASRTQLLLMTVVSFTIFGAGFLVAGLFGDLAMHR
ncbi:DUF4396 domain-containing protein [Streptomyces sp. NPDC059906]|uniref:DUF4396 domain-containing protein n=1 Tax=Streptomyces sp. NPDC059906 TaxID=3346997 RepID=UPI00364A1A8B